MKKQIEIASGMKNSSPASTEAHETRKSNTRRLSYCVIVLFAVAATFTSCDNKNDDDDVHDAGKKYAQELCECFQITDPQKGKDCVSALESKKDYEKWWDHFQFESAVVTALGANCDVGYPDWWGKDNVEPEPEKENIYLIFVRLGITNEHLHGAETTVRQHLANQNVDTVFLQSGDSWKGTKLTSSHVYTNNLMTIQAIDEDRIFGYGVLDPDEISKSDSTRLAKMKFIVLAEKVIGD